MASFLNKVWSGLDVWDKKENEQQRKQFAAPRPQPARAPQQRNTFTDNSVTRGASRSFDQLNPFDGGRTWKQRTPTMPKLSTVHQLTHNGVTNMLGDSVVKPTIRMGLAVNQGIGNLELKLAGRKTQNAEDYFNMPGTRMLQQKTGYTGTKRQIAGDTITTAANVAMPGSSKALNAGISKTSAKVVPKVIQKTTPQVIKSVAPKVVGNAVVGGTGGAVSNVGALVSSNDPLNRQTILKSAKDGAITGAAIGGAIPIAAPLAKAGGKATVRGAKIIDAQANGAPKRQAQNMVANRNMKQADAIRLQAREDIRVANANKLPQNHPLRRNATAKLKEADAVQMSVMPVKLTRTQKIFDPLFTKQPGLTIGGPLAREYQKMKDAGLVFEGVDGKPRFEVDDSGAKLNDKEFSWGIKMDGKPRKVGQILEHDKLFEQYPELKDVNVRYEPNDLPGHDAHFDPDTNTIVITKSRADKSHLSDIIHELQHTIQGKEGFAGGGAPEYRNYKAENASIKRGLQDVNTTLSGKNLTPEQTQRLRAKRDNLIKQLEQTQDQYGNVFTKAKDIADYRNLAGEAEARAVEARMNMPMSERYVKPDNSFRDGHVAPSKDTTPTAQKVEDGGDFSLTEVAQGSHNQPSDYFDQRVGARYYGYDNLNGRQSETAINNVVRALKAGKNDVTITAYRTVPKGVKVNDLQNSDWITFSENYAKQHGDHRFGEGEYKVIKQDVKPDDVHWDGNDINEWGYDNGVSTPQSTFYDSLDVPKQDLIIRNGDGKAMSIDDPTAALKAEALKYKSADEFLQAKADEGGKLSDTLEPFGNRTPEQAKLEDLHYGINLGDVNGDIPKTIKEYTDLYNQAHTPQPKPDVAPEPKAMSIGEEKYPGLVDEILNAPNAREASQLAEQRGIWLELSDAVLNVMKRDRGTALDIINNSKPKGDYIKKVQQPLEKKVQEAQAEMDKYGDGYINDIDRAAEQAKAKARLDQAKEALDQTSGSNLRYGKAMSVEPKDLTKLPSEELDQNYTDLKETVSSILNDRKNYGKDGLLTPESKKLGTELLDKAEPYLAEMRRRLPKPTIKGNASSAKVTALDSNKKLLQTQDPMQKVFDQNPVNEEATLLQNNRANKQIGMNNAINDNFAKNGAELPDAKVHTEKWYDKMWRDTQSIIERQGKAGQELSGMLNTARDNRELWLADIERRIPTVLKLKGKDFSDFVEATQGNIPIAKGSKVEKAVNEWRAVHPEIRQRGVNAGLEIGDLGSTYYPHFVDYDRIFKDKNTYNQAINHLVSTNQAPNAEAAMQLLSQARDVSRNRRFGNLESSRLIDLPFYDKTNNSLRSYLASSAKRIADAEVFGPKDENALKLITEAGRNGFDTEAMKNAYDVAVGARRYGATASKISRGVRQYNTTTKLGLGAMTNIAQNVNTGVVTGHMNTLKNMAKMATPESRKFAHETGVIADAVINDLREQQGYSFAANVLGKGVKAITAPMFGTVEKFNRAVAANAGRDYAIKLAKKGDVKTLRRLGVTGDISRNLTLDQQIQAARKVVEKTQFKVDPQDLPGWVDSPGGKLVAQFRSFSYNQGKFFSNEILKPIHKDKNMMPLIRLMAAMPLGYGLYEMRRIIAGQPEEENPTKVALQSFSKIGGAGLATDIYQGINPVGSKYLPSDRRQSMAASSLGGPTVGTAMQGVGALSDLAQRKNTPKDLGRLDGKIAVAKTSDSYTDATPAARFALQQVPIVGTPIKNRVLPFKKESQADTGKLPLEGKASAATATTSDPKELLTAAFSTKQGREMMALSEEKKKEWAKQSSDNQALYNQYKTMKQRFSPSVKDKDQYSATELEFKQREAGFQEKGRNTWYKRLDSKYSGLYNSANEVTKAMGVADLPKTNQTVSDFISFNKQYQGAKNDLERGDLQKEFVKKAYRNSLTDTQKYLFGNTYNDSQILAAVDKGIISLDDIKTAVGLDNYMKAKGLSSSLDVSKKVRALIGAASGGSGGSRGRGRTAKGSRRKSKVTSIVMPTYSTANRKMQSLLKSTRA